MISDKYNMEESTDFIKDGIMDDNDSDDGDEANTGGNFLKVFKEGEEKPVQEEEEIKDGQVKFKAAPEEDIDLKLPGKDGDKPAIEELSSKEFDFDHYKKALSMDKPEPVRPKEKDFDWEKAERVDAKFQFVNQSELVFVTFNFKGYVKGSDVRYALSANEVFLEVRDIEKNKVHRVCKTLTNQVDVMQSDV